ncbi:MAG: VOC family protein [Proteobacteria bacterium]|nr:VOC family protein [Pseudomonadota bacterium]
MALDYVMIGTNDHGRAQQFYGAVFAAIGGEMVAEYPAAVCYRFGNGTQAWVAAPFDGQAAAPGNGNMPGFRCASTAEVDAAHAAALANGGSNEGGPGPRPQYGPEFYGGYVRDPDGNKLSLICHRPVS